MRLDKSAIVGTALGGGDGSSLADKLCELQTARDEELLTESEFQAARQNAERGRIARTGLTAGLP